MVRKESKQMNSKELVNKWLDSKHGADRAHDLIYFSDELIDFVRWFNSVKVVDLSSKHEEKFEIVIKP